MEICAPKFFSLQAARVDPSVYIDYVPYGDGDSSAKGQSAAEEVILRGRQLNSSSLHTKLPNFTLCYSLQISEN